MDPFPDLMLAPDSPARIDLAAGCSRQAVHQWFGDQDALRVTVAARFVARRRRWTDVRVHHFGVAAMLPDCEPVLAWTQMWLALVECAPRHETIAGLVAGCTETDLEVLGRSIEKEAWRRREVAVSALPVAVRGLHGLVDGLRLQLARDTERLTDHFAAAACVVGLALEQATDDLLEGTCLTSSKPVSRAPGS